MGLWTEDREGRGRTGSGLGSTAHIAQSAPRLVVPTTAKDATVRIVNSQATPGASPNAANVDHEQLARQFPDVSGTNIRNAAITATFRAAADCPPKITQDHLIR